MNKQNTAITLIIICALTISGYFLFKQNIVSSNNQTTNTSNTPRTNEPESIEPNLQEIKKPQDSQAVNEYEYDSELNNVDTTNWENYTNESVGYTISYPNNWTIEGLNPGSGNTEIVGTSRGVVITGPYVTINIETELGTGNYIDWAENLAANQYYTVETKTDELLGNANALKLTGRNVHEEGTKLITNYLLSNLDSEYYISVLVVSNEQLTEEETKTLQTTLNSFQLIN